MDNNFKDEVWKPIPDFPNYEISNYGRIKQADKIGKRIVKREETFVIPGKILKLPKGKGRLCKGGEVYVVSSNQLALEVFKKEPELIDSVEDLPGEVWKKVKGYTGIYRVSNLGRVKSITREIKDKSGRTFIRMGKLLGQYICKDSGYYKVQLSKNGKTKTVLVHRLVGEAFVPNPGRLPVFNHLDENKLNNNADNLQPCTNEYNRVYSTTKKYKRVGQYDENDNLIKIFPSLTDASTETGIYWKWIDQCVKGKKESVDGFKFKYED